MSSYPNPGDPNQPHQYPPDQGQTGTPNAPPGYGEQAPYQQGAHQQYSYRQSPYESPYAQDQSTMALDWRYLTAGIGALLSLIVFFVPSYSSAILVVPIANILGVPAYSLSNTSSLVLSGAQLGRQLWLDVIIALVALSIAALLQFGNQIFKAPMSPNIQKLVNSLNTRPRTWGIALLVVGACGIFFHFILDLGVLSFWGIGAWLYLLGMIAVVIGGFFVYRPPTSIPTQIPPIR